MLLGVYPPGSACAAITCLTLTWQAWVLHFQACQASKSEMRSHPSRPNAAAHISLQHSAPCKVACLQAILAIVRLLCMRLPTVEFHAGSMLLAVAQGAARGVHSPMGDHVTLYDMETGARRRNLQLRWVQASGW